MWEAFQRRPVVFVLAMVLLLAILAVVISPVVDLPNCAERGKRIAYIFQWLLTLAVGITTLMWPGWMFSLRPTAEESPRGAPPVRLRSSDCDLTCARLR